MKSQIRKSIIDDSEGANTIKEVIKSEEILNEVKRFYTNLFSKKGDQSEDTCISFIDELPTPLLSEHEQNTCNEDISINDLETSLLSMENNKSPGNDGLTKEFYVRFWDSIKNPLINSFLMGKHRKQLSPSQRQAVIKLLEKKGKDKRYIKKLETDLFT